MDAQVDGSKPLAEQQTAINYAEQLNNAQLVSYQKGPAPANFATLQSMPMGQNIPPLLLIEVPITASVGSIVATQLATGKHLVFYSAVYVKSVETKVAGFR